MPFITTTPGATANFDAAGGNVDPSDIGTVGSNPLSGFAANWLPSTIEDLYNSPWAAIGKVFSGINRSGPGYQALRDFGADPLTLYNIMQGYNQNLAAGGGAGDYANWLGALYQQLGTRGGRSFSGRELLGKLFNPGADSTLQQILTSGTGSQQASTLQSLVRDATNVGANPLAARAYQMALRNALDAYTQAYGTAPDAGSGAANQSAYQWLRQNRPGLVPR